LTVIAASMARFGSLIAAGIGIPLACYVGWRVWIMIHMLRHLRLRRITPLLVHERITSGEQIAVLDLLDFEDVPRNVQESLGQSGCHPSASVVASEHVEMVLYCSSGEFTNEDAWRTRPEP
jgi:hypothetical protein